MHTSSEIVHWIWQLHIPVTISPIKKRTFPSPLKICLCSFLINPEIHQLPLIQQWHTLLRFLFSVAYFHCSKTSYKWSYSVYSCISGFFWSTQHFWNSFTLLYASKFVSFLFFSKSITWYEYNTTKFFRSSIGNCSTCGKCSLAPTWKIQWVWGSAGRTHAHR